MRRNSSGIRAICDLALVAVGCLALLIAASESNDTVVETSKRGDRIARRRAAESLVRGRRPTSAVVQIPRPAMGLARDEQAGHTGREPGRRPADRAAADRR